MPSQVTKIFSDSLAFVMIIRRGNELRNKRNCSHRLLLHPIDSSKQKRVKEDNEISGNAESRKKNRRSWTKEDNLKF